MLIEFFEANPGKYLATYSADKMNWEDEHGRGRWDGIV